MSITRRETHKVKNRISDFGHEHGRCDCFLLRAQRGDRKFLKLSKYLHRLCSKNCEVHSAFDPKKYRGTFPKSAPQETEHDMQI